MMDRTSRDEINGLILSKKLNILFIIYNFKRNRFLHLMTTLHNVQMMAKPETMGTGVEKVKVPAIPDNLITKLFFANEYPDFVFLSTSEESRGHPILTRKIQLILSLQLNTTFFYIFMAVKYSFF